MVVKAINGEWCKKMKWYMEEPESFQENEMHEIF